jgi:DNA-3-methyladenine glycosylase
MKNFSDSSNPRKPSVKSGIFDRHPALVARDLIGAFIAVDGVGGLVIETEAYHHEDPASHAYGGMTPRNAAMFGPTGHTPMSIGATASTGA